MYKNLIRHILILLLLIIAANNSHAQYNFNKVDEWLADNVAQMGGRAFLVIYKDGAIVHTREANDMSRRQKAVDKFIAKRQGREANTAPYTISAVQPIASCSKWLSAALIMSFVDEGKIELDDTVGKWLPVLVQHGKGNITIGHCLSHLTGIKAPELKESLQQFKELNSMDEAIEKIAELPMEGEPGKTFRYSSVGLQIATSVIEKIMGKNSEALFAERIARPLEMKNTSFGKKNVVLPAGGASGTPEDYINFLGMILNKGIFNGKRVLSEKSIAQMQVNQITQDVKVMYAPPEAGDFGYGYGEWVMQSRNAAEAGETITSPGLFGSFPWVNNKEKYAAFLMTFYLKSEGRHERYVQLKALVDDAVK